LDFGKYESLGKQVSPCVARGSLAYTFSGLLIWMQHVKSVVENFLNTAGKKKNIWLILYEKRSFATSKQNKKMATYSR